MKPENTLKGTPWDDEPATEEELAEIKKHLEEDNNAPISKELEDHLKEIPSIGRCSYSYGDEDQNDLMHEINKGIHE